MRQQYRHDEKPDWEMVIVMAFGIIGLAVLVLTTCTGG